MDKEKLELASQGFFNNDFKTLEGQMWRKFTKEELETLEEWADYLKELSESL